MARNVTITDKDRTVGMTENGEWNPFSIKDRDGKIKWSVKPDEPGVYILQYQLLGRIITKPTTRLELRIQRYPIDPADGGTAWDYIDLDKTVKPSVWFGTRSGKVEILAAGDYSTSVGIDYRVSGGRIERNQIVLKFIRQEDNN